MDQGPHFTFSIILVNNVDRAVGGRPLTARDDTTLLRELHFEAEVFSNENLPIDLRLQTEVLRFGRIKS